MQSIGDLAGQLTTRLHHARTKALLNTLGQEASTGVAADLAQHRGGDMGPLAALVSDLARTEAYLRTGTELAVVGASIQSALGLVESQASDLAQDLIRIDAGSTPNARENVSRIAGQAFEAIVSTLNTHTGGRFLFSGTSTLTQPVEDAQVLRADIAAHLSGAVTASDVVTAVDAWFDAPSGRFEQIGYLGSGTGKSPVALSDSDAVTMDIKADHGALRTVLKAAVMADLVTDPGLGFSVSTQTNVLQAAGAILMSNQTDLIGLGAEIGAAEAKIQTALSANSQRRSDLLIQRNDLIAIDPFETATALESTRSQLETMYAVTARRQHLSLVDFLR